MTFCDSHFHLVQCSHVPSFEGRVSYRSCTCAHEQNEFLQQEALFTTREELKGGVSAFGIHPQNPDLRRLPFLEQLLKEDRIGAIGEAGFDLFSEEFSSHIDEQETAWKSQVELAAFYGVPLVVHCRKGTDRLFRDIRELKKLSAVVFHSYAGTRGEALSFLNRGINAFFSFGKPLLNGKKSALECCVLLPFDRILLETDAPYQTLKGESETAPEEIERVYEKAAQIRRCSLEDLALQIEKNFCSAFAVS